MEENDPMAAMGGERTHVAYGIDPWSPERRERPRVCDGPELRSPCGMGASARGQPAVPARVSDRSMPGVVVHGPNFVRPSQRVSGTGQNTGSSPQRPSGPCSRMAFSLLGTPLPRGVGQWPPLMKHG
jgi:hypothetical protein